MKDRFLKLTNAVYKVLEFFPDSDPLKNRAKDKALAIMENLVLVNGNKSWTRVGEIIQGEKIKIQILEDIDILLGYLWIAKTQGWLNSANFLIIANEYEKIKKESGPTIELTKKLPGMDGLAKPEIEEKPEINLSPRQNQILDFLTKNQKAQVMDLQTIFPDITKRTIRRDLDDLLEADKIVRTGDFNQVSYQLKK